MTEKQLDIIGLGASTVDIITLVDHFPTRREINKLWLRPFRAEAR